MAKECNNMKEHKKNTFIVLKRDKAKKLKYILGGVCKL